MSVLWIFRLVVPEVDFEIPRSLELLFADGTLELLGIGVDQHVPVDQVALSVVLATKFAPIGEIYNVSIRGYLIFMKNHYKGMMVLLKYSNKCLLID